MATAGRESICSRASTRAYVGWVLNTLMCSTPTVRIRRLRCDPNTRRAGDSEVIAHAMRYPSAALQHVRPQSRTWPFGCARRVGSRMHSLLAFSTGPRDRSLFARHSARLASGEATRIPQGGSDHRRAPIPNHATQRAGNRPRAEFGATRGRLGSAPRNTIQSPPSTGWPCRPRSCERSITF